MKIISVIPARGGSKGIPQKNIRLLNGFPVIAYSIVASQQSKLINRSIVSTDSDEIAAISRQYGAEVPFLRPPALAGDQSPDIEFVNHLLDFLNETEGGLPDYLVHLRPTTPLRDPQIIDKAIETFLSAKNATSLRSGHLSSESPFKWFLKDADGFFKGVASSFTNDMLNNPRQGFPDVYIPDGYVDVLDVAYIRETGQLHGPKIMAFESPQCTEIDTMRDFEILNFDLNTNECDIFNAMKGNSHGK